MTASPSRRRRASIVAVAVAVAATLAATGLAVAGGLTIYNSTDATDPRRTTPERIFPETPTALLAAVDGGGALASLAVLVGAPGGVGGSVVSVPVDADSSSGEGDERLPIDESFALQGEASMENEAEIALSLGIDVTEVVDAERLASILAPIGAIEVDLPIDVTGASGNVVATAGAQTLDPQQLASVLTARDPGRTAHEQYPAASVVWAAIASAVGDGLAVETGTGTLDPVLAGLLAGPVRQRPLAFQVAPPAQNPRDVDAVLLDRSDLALVFGQIAPGNVSAPNPALSFRVESPFDDTTLGPGRSRSELAYDAISQLLFVRANVVSVDTAAGETPAVTQVVVSDDSMLGEVRGLEPLFGPIELSVADERIAGVDAVVRLGTSFLEFVAASE